MHTPDDLAALIARQGIAAELISGIGDTPTVPAAAAALGVPEQQIIKTMLFFVSGQPYAVITHGATPVPARPLADRFGVGKRQIKLARADQVLAITGYPAGGVPPFGHQTEIDILLDRSVLDWEIVYGGGGDDRTMMKIASAELLRVTGAELIEIDGAAGS